MHKRNTPGPAGSEGVDCRHCRDIDVYATEARLLQQIRVQLPILSRHVGLDRLGQFEEIGRG